MADRLLYAAGRIRSIEARMLSEQHLTRMADARDFESAFLVLNESSYAENIGKLTRPFDFMELLDLEFASLKAFVLAMAPGSREIELLLEKFGPVRAKGYRETLKGAVKGSGSKAFRRYANAYLSREGTEKEFDDGLVDIARRAKYASFGIDPLVGFFIGKDIEMKNVRLILTGKLLRAAPEEIRSRIRIAYA